MKTAYITDSGTGYSMDFMAKKGIFSLPLQIEINGKNYFDLEQITNNEVLECLGRDDKMSTSLPSLGLIDDLIKKIKEQGFDNIIAVPICNGLSGTINALNMTAHQYLIPIKCIDNYVTAELERYLIEFIKDSREHNVDDEAIFKTVDEIIDSANTILVPDSLAHLSKSGRLTPMAAGIGDFFNIKPILEINKRTNGRIDVSSKVRTFKKALTKANEIMLKEIDTNNRYDIYIAHVDAYDKAVKFKANIETQFANADIHIIPLCSPVAIHTGLGCIAIQYFKKKTLY